MSKIQKRQNLLRPSEVERGRNGKRIYHTDLRTTRPPKKRNSTLKKKKKDRPANVLALHHGPACSHRIPLPLMPPLQHLPLLPSRFVCRGLMWEIFQLQTLEVQVPRANHNFCDFVSNGSGPLLAIVVLVRLPLIPVFPWET